MLTNDLGKRRFEIHLHHHWARTQQVRYLFAFRTLVLRVSDRLPTVIIASSTSRLAMCESSLRIGAMSSSRTLLEFDAVNNVAERYG